MNAEGWFSFYSESKTASSPFQFELASPILMDSLEDFEPTASFPTMSSQPQVKTESKARKRRAEATEGHLRKRGRQELEQQVRILDQKVDHIKKDVDDIKLNLQKIYELLLQHLRSSKSSS